MNRTTALILTLVATLLCGCPGLCACAYSFATFTASEEQVLQQMQELGIQNVGDIGGSLTFLRICTPLVALLLIAIPIVIGIVTFNQAKKQAVASEAFPSQLQ